MYLLDLHGKNPGVSGFFGFICSIGEGSLAPSLTSGSRRERGRLKATTWWFRKYGFEFRAGLKGILILILILGTSWIFGILANFQFGVILEYLFVVTNCLQGVFVFCFHCLGNSEVRSALLRKLKQRNLQNKVSSMQQTTSSKTVTVLATSNYKDYSEARMEQQTLSRFVATSVIRSAKKGDTQRRTRQHVPSFCSSVGDEFICDRSLDNYQDKKEKDKKAQEHIFMKPRVFNKNSTCGKYPHNK